MIDYQQKIVLLLYNGSREDYEWKDFFERILELLSLVMVVNERLGLLYKGKIIRRLNFLDMKVWVIILDFLKILNS